jgi:hypothetical protein
MEYQRPRYDETPDHWLVERHEREIAPLLKRRSLFAESSNFLLYDFFQSSGSVDENVFAYSNRNGNDRALVVFNNRYGATHGTIDNSAAYADKGAAQLRQQRLREGLGLSGNTAAILAFRDSLTGLEYLRTAETVSGHGLTLDLHAYQCHVFLDWRELHATAQHPWDRLCAQLNGAGVPSLDDALINLELRSVHEALRLQLDPDLVRMLGDLAEHPRTLAGGSGKESESARSQFYELAWQRCQSFLNLAQTAYVSRGGRPTTEKPTNPVLLSPVFRERIRAAMRLPAIEAMFPTPWPAAARRVLPSPSPQFTATAMWGPLLAWCALQLLAESINPHHPEAVALDIFDRLRFREPFAKAFSALGFDGETGWRVAARIKVVLLTGAGIGREEPQTLTRDARAVHAAEEGHEEESHSELRQASGHDFSRAEETSISTRALAPAVFASAISEKAPTSGRALYQGATSVVPQAPKTETGALAPASAPSEPIIPPALWSDPDVRWLTGVHTAEGHNYFFRESYEELLWWLLLPSLLRIAGEAAPASPAVAQMVGAIHQALAAAEAAGYRVDLLITPPDPEPPIEPPSRAQEPEPAPEQPQTKP